MIISIGRSSKSKGRERKKEEEAAWASRQNFSHFEVRGGEKFRSKRTRHQLVCVLPAVLTTACLQGDPKSLICFLCFKQQQQRQQTNNNYITIPANWTWSRPHTNKRAGSLLALYLHLNWKEHANFLINNSFLFAKTHSLVSQPASQSIGSREGN